MKAKKRQEPWVPIVYEPQLCKTYYYPDIQDRYDANEYPLQIPRAYKLSNLRDFTINSNHKHIKGVKW